jgi:hypothetical protein
MPGQSYAPVTPATAPSAHTVTDATEVGEQAAIKKGTVKPAKAIKTAGCADTAGLGAGIDHLCHMSTTANLLINPV